MVELLNKHEVSFMISCGSFFGNLLLENNTKQTHKKPLYSLSSMCDYDTSQAKFSSLSLFPS